MILLDDTGGILHDLIHGLDNAVRRQAAVFFGEVHAAPGGKHPDAQFLSGGELGANQITGVGGKHIVVVKAGGAAVLHQLSHTGKRGETDDALV